MKIVKWTLCLFFLMATGIFAGCDRGDLAGAEEQAKNEINTGHGQTEEQTNAQRSDGMQAGESRTERTGEGQGFEGESWKGRQVVSSDGRLMGTVAETDGGYVVVRAGARMHPVPENLIRKGIRGPGLKADFDLKTFQESPFFSESEKDGLSESRLNEVRGYFGNVIGKRK